MSSTKFKVKQVKSDSETGLETFVELPIDQEDTARLMPSQAGIDIGTGALNWGDAYLGDVECGEVACGTLAVTGQVAALSASITEGLTAGTGTFDTLVVVGTLTVGSSNNAAGTVAIENRTFVPPSGVNDLEFKSVNNMYVTLDTDESGSDAFFRIRRKDGDSFLNEFEVTEGGVCKSNEFSSIDGTAGVLLHSEDGVTLSTQANKNPDLKITSTEIQTFTKTLVLGNGVKGTNDAKVEAKKGLSIPNGEALQCRTIEPSPSASDIELKAVNDIYLTLDSDDSGVGNLYMRRGADNATFFEANEAAVSKLVPELTINFDESNINGWHLLAVNSNGLLAKSTDEANDLLNHHNFTGSHAYTSAVSSIDIGDAVILNHGLTLEKCSQASISNCVGIIQKVDSATEDNPLTTSLGEVVTSGSVYYVAAVGDSIKGDLQGFKVCNEGGEISAGDLLVTSSVPGRLMKQADDVIRASTVGKAMQAVTFNDQGQADDVYGFLYCG